MAKTVAIAEIPTPTRTSGPGKYDEICKQLADLVTDEKVRTTSGLMFDASDGVILADTPDGKKSNVGQVCQVLRLAAKSVGAKIKLVIREEGLYASFNGDYVEMTPAEKAARQEARANNAAARNMQANTAAKTAAKK